MRRRFQWLVLVTLGLVVLRTVLTGTFLRYVQPGMRLMLLASAIVLILLGIADLLRATPASDHHQAGDAQDQAVPGRDADSDGHGHDGHGHGHAHASAPRAAWLLLLPTLCFAALSPPALSSYTATRAVDISVVDNRTPEEIRAGFPPLPSGPVLSMSMLGFSARALWDRSASLQGRTLRLTGFVSERPQGGWYLTRLKIRCCLADATTIRVRVFGVPSPPVDQWVSVDGTWGRQVFPASAYDKRVAPEPARIEATRVREVPEPDFPYE